MAKFIFKSGFTLIELIVVIVLISILSSTALPKFFGVQESSYESVARSVYESVNLGLQVYKLQAYEQVNSDNYVLTTSVNVVNGSNTSEYYLYWNAFYNPIGVGESESEFYNNPNAPSFNKDTCEKFLYILTDIAYDEISSSKWLTESLSPNSCQWTYMSGAKQYIITYNASTNPYSLDFLIA